MACTSCGKKTTTPSGYKKTTAKPSFKTKANAGSRAAHMGMTSSGISRSRNSGTTPISHAQTGTRRRH